MKDRDALPMKVRVSGRVLLVAVGFQTPEKELATLEMPAEVHVERHLGVVEVIRLSLIHI